MKFKHNRDRGFGSYLNMVDILDNIRYYYDGNITLAYNYISGVLNSAYRREPEFRYNYYL